MGFSFEVRDALFIVFSMQSLHFFTVFFKFERSRILQNLELKKFFSHPSVSPFFSVALSLKTCHFSLHYCVGLIVRENCQVRDGFCFPTIAFDRVNIFSSFGNNFEGN